MHYVFLSNNIVTDQCEPNPYSVFFPEYASQFIEVPDEVTFGWSLVDGAWVSPPAPPAPTPDVIRDEIIQQTQRRLDDFAKTSGYDGILSLCTYATSTVPKFQTEGQYGVEARDSTWAKLYEIMAEVEDGTRPMPEGYANIEPELPLLEWPVLVQ